jgi:hypothetical protein
MQPAAWATCRRRAHGPWREHPGHKC